MSSRDTSIKLKKYFSREYPLFYINVWCHGNLEGLKEYIHHILFIFSPGELVTAWWQKEEWNKYIRESGKKARDIDYTRKIVKKFLSLTKELTRFLNPSLLVDIEDLKQYYQILLKWWPLLAIIFAIPERVTIPESKEIALKARRETQDFNDRIPTIFEKFFKKSFPHLKEYTSVILPKEVFTLDQSESFLDLVSEWEKRLAHTFYYYNDKIYFDDKFKKLPVYLEKETLDDVIDVIQGQPGYYGKVKGRVCVILFKSDIYKLRRKEILVTHMTTPDFLPIMKKASAIITDEGGITSHASIISRELKIPCIIGTKVATKVLQDGDLVEVDANRGMVTVLRKAK